MCYVLRAIDRESSELTTLPPVVNAVDFGHDGPARGCNFAVLFPVWDILFGTARFDGRFEATGIRDQLPEHGGRNYGQGFWAQQWLGLRRLVGRDAV